MFYTNRKRNNEEIVIATGAGVVCGLLLGYTLGVLTAPKAGKETRKEITDKSKEILEEGKTKVRKLQKNKNQ